MSGQTFQPGDRVRVPARAILKSEYGTVAMPARASGGQVRVRLDGDLALGPPRLFDPNEVTRAPTSSAAFRPGTRVRVVKAGSRILPVSERQTGRVVRNNGGTTFIRVQLDETGREGLYYANELEKLPPVAVKEIMRVIREAAEREALQAGDRVEVHSYHPLWNGANGTVVDTFGSADAGDADILSGAQTLRFPVRNLRLLERATASEPPEPAEPAAFLCGGLFLEADTHPCDSCTPLTAKEAAAHLLKEADEEIREILDTLHRQVQGLLS